MRLFPPSGLSIHTFHGNFFVRSTDLLSLANVNPDSAFAVQMSIEDSLADSSLACFQAALLYTSSKGRWWRDSRRSAGSISGLKTPIPLSPKGNGESVSTPCVCPWSTS